MCMNGSRTMVKTYLDGLDKALEIAIKTTDDFWNEEYARHGNPGLATMKQKVGKRIERAIIAEMKIERKAEG